MKPNFQRTYWILGAALLGWAGMAWYGAHKSSVSSETEKITGSSSVAASTHASSSISSKPVVPAPKLNPISVSSYEAVHGKETRSVVVVNKKRMELTSNIAGEFPRVQVKPQETIPVRVTFPGGDPGDFVMIEAKDGGHLENRKIVKPTSLDAKRGVDFEFTTNQESDEFKNKANKALDDLRKRLPDMMKTLDKSDFSHKIKEQAPGYWSENVKDNKGCEPQGTTTAWEPNNKTDPADTTGKDRSPIAGLAHELQHAYDNDQGKLNNTRPDKWSPPESESRAVRTENIVRDAYGDNLADNYRGQKVPEHDSYVKNGWKD